MSISSDINATYYAMRLISHRIDISDLRQDEVGNDLSEEFTPEERTLAFQIIEEIQKRERILIQNLSESKSQTYVSSLADRIEEFSDIEIAQAGYDISKADQMLEELRQTLSGAAKPESVSPQVEYRLGQIIYASPQMRDLDELLKLAGSTNVTLLITGESGTGKELVASTLHALSGRASKPFCSINLSAYPEHLVESELFGHVKGAFTGAISEKSGLVKEANGGTLFLDEITEIPPSLQIKLLRLLQEREYRPLGGKHQVKVDVRIICSSSRDIGAAVREGSFREDLYYRLNIMPIHIPPLRERTADIVPLASHFLETFAQQSNHSVKSLSPAALGKLLAYEWPGNVRELRNTIERAVIITSNDMIDVRDLPETISRGSDKITPLDEALLDVKRQIILEAFEKAGGNLSKAADMLGIHRSTFLRRLRKYHINVQAHDES